MGLRRAIAGGGTMAFGGYGDLSLAELLPAVLTRYSETELLIAAPSLPDQAADAILSWMKKTWARMDGKGSLWRVSHLTVVSDLSEEQSPMASAWLKDNPLGDRLTLVDTAQPDTAILLPDFAITGPVNMQYNAHFTAEATTEQSKVAALWEKFMPKANEDMPAPSLTEQVAALLEEGPDEQPAETVAKPKAKAAKKQKKDAE